ncbi:conserved hypothetical protein [Neospora caninum Liverpool]|uniref:Uncharacterized protein n=1 Tax=Neospora caninum (strain Liverpool) TaxID=572307 RepID=F0VD52_NEOCL|nr:conserved hypothetical protein [Neospora caninum Liverpool]CBZ51567.1 conserved hypothetical protein [Neospora caninum Liverpool]|eukprot:XP_003881600.1 conserved hypothetical protein [Neospora caninum Liverpool]
MSRFILQLKKACSEALQTAQEMVKRITDEKEALEVALEEQEQAHACRIRNFQLLESNVANAVKQARAYKADKSELKCKLQRLSQEERIRADAKHPVFLNGSLQHAARYLYTDQTWRAAECQVTCRIDWRLEKDRYLRLKHVINRKVGQLLKLQKLAKSAAAANRCPLY